MSKRVLLARASVAIAIAINVALLAPSRAFAEDGADVLEACASAAERGQVARHEGKLLDARGEFRRCEAAECPAVVRSDCTRWDAEIEEETPSVVLRARDSRGQDVIDVRVSANRQLLTYRLDGEAIALDPGRYDFHYETASGAVATETILLAVGERRRVIAATFSMPLKADGTAAASPSIPVAMTHMPPASAAGEHASPPVTGPRPTAYVFAGAAAVSLGAFAYLELRGQSGYSDLENGCGRTKSCPSDQVDPVRTDFVAAASFLAGAVVFAGLATWQFLSPRRPPVAGWLRPPSAAGRGSPAVLVRF